MHFSGRNFTCVEHFPTVGPLACKSSGSSSAMLLSGNAPELAALDAGSYLVRIRLQASDLAGNPLSSVAAGSDFQLQAWVQDLRGIDDGGVFAAYLNVDYDPRLASIDRGLGYSPVVAGSRYRNSTGHDTHTPGQIIATGGITGSMEQTGGGELLLWSVTVHADHGGLLTFTPGHVHGNGLDALVYGLDNRLADNQVQLVGTSLEVSGDDAGSDSGAGSGADDVDPRPIVMNPRQHDAPVYFTNPARLWHRRR